MTPSFALWRRWLTVRLPCPDGLMRYNGDEVTVGLYEAHDGQVLVSRDAEQIDPEPVDATYEEVADYLCSVAVLPARFPWAKP